MGRSNVFTAAMALIAVVLLCLMFLMVTYTPPQPAAAGWELPGNGSVDYMFIGGNDTLYAFRGNDVAAIRSDGSLAWAYTVPDNWSVLNNWSQAGHTIEARPVVAESDGHLYLIAVKHLTQEDKDKINSIFIQSGFGRIAMIMAISPDGKEEWEYPFTFATPSSILSSLLYDDTIMPYTIALSVHDDNIYLFKDYTEQIIDLNLQGVKRIDDVASPAAIDEEGRIYVVRTRLLSSSWENPDVPADAEITGNLYWYDGMLPTGIIEAYSPDRTLLWSRDIGHSAIRGQIGDNAWDKFNTLPLYINRTLYVPLKDGAIALDWDGNVKWECHLPENDTYSLFDLMPGDEQGNIYFRSLGIIPQNPDDLFGRFFPTPQPVMPEYLYVISPEGTVSRQEWAYGPSGVVSLVPVTADNGIIYTVNSTGAINDETFKWMIREDRLNPDRLMAVDAKSGMELWNFTVPAADKHLVVLNAGNLGHALPGFTPDTVDELMKRESRQGWRPGLPISFYGNTGRIEVYPGGKVTYLNYYFATYESPIIYDRSKCIYARSIYAIDENGKMLWGKPVAGLVTAMAANNSTFYYGTSDGRIGTVTGNALVAGFALIATLYLFFRFFVLGTISRAKARLDKNKNRNTVLQYIVDNPGVTAVDVSKALKMNLGTTRYHLFILTANHRIITHKKDSKFLRYFTNAGTYSEKERSLLSVMRREPLKRILKTLAERPGLSNLELARELNVSTAAVHDNVNELYTRGIVTKDAQGDRGYAYAIKEEYCHYITKNMEKL
jgi:predicted transcriptional regulator/outer membrane protein assembly factor BamB